MANFFSANCDDVIVMDDVTDWDDKVFSVDDNPSATKAWAEARLFKIRITLLKYILKINVELFTVLIFWISDKTKNVGKPTSDQCVISFATFYRLSMPLKCRQPFFQSASKYRRQSYKINLVLKKTNLVLNSLMVRYLNSDCNNTVVWSKLR